LRSRFEKFAAKVYQVRQARGVIIKFGGSWQSNVDFCTTTVIDRLTTSFNWAEVNFGAIWLRPQWYVVLNSAVTDQLAGGPGFVGGGNWAQVPPSL